MIVIIKGRNLVPLLRAIQEWKVEWLAEFDPEEHIEPAA
jgi:DNA-binding HxlR family transcriptional regulator